MRIIDADALEIKLDAELMDVSDYLSIHEQIKDIIDNAPSGWIPVVTRKASTEEINEIVTELR